MANCVVCGKPLQTTRKNVKFCSSTCRSRDHRARLKAEAEARRYTLSLECAAMLERLRLLLPSTSTRVERFIDENGIQCAEAAIKLCLSAYVEATAAH